MRDIIPFLCLILAFSCKKPTTEVTPPTKMVDVKTVNYSELEPMLNYNDSNTYVINFWATWCKPCVEEMPYFQELHNTYSDQNIKVILVSLDFPDKIESQLIPFIKEKKLTPQVVLLDDPDENYWIPKIDESWSGALPATLIYNKDKRAFYEQSFTKESLFKEIKKFTKL